VNTQINNFSELVQVKRTQMGLTQRAFAELLGLGDTGERTVRGWELGEHRPSHTKINQMMGLPSMIPFINPFSNNPEAAKFRFIDLFAGIGGIRLPFQAIGGNCVFTSEWDKFSKRTYAANFGDVPEGDITKILAEDIPPHDLLLAGFPCQAFSQAGRRQGFNDTRGTMFFEIQRILATHRPKAFLLENVKQLRGHDKGRTLNMILEILRGTDIAPIPETIPMSKEARKSLCTKLNYRVSFEVLKAKDFGVPQNRERVYIIGFDRNQVAEAEKVDICVDIFTNLKSRKSETRLGEVLQDNGAVDPKYTISDRLLEGHKRRLKQHKEKGNGFGFSIFNSESAYCNTISARYYKDGSEIMIDQSNLQKNPRKLTPRECARIQGFPENFNVNVVSDVQIYKQFGNSVSVPVIEAIASEMKKYIV
jgi:DNA (cytosine-5)-methyltransferase 1